MASPLQPNGNLGIHTADRGSQSQMMSGLDKHLLGRGEGGICLPHCNPSSVSFCHNHPSSIPNYKLECLRASSGVPQALGPAGRTIENFAAGQPLLSISDWEQCLGPSQALPLK